MGQSRSSVLCSCTILRNAAGEGMSCPGKEAIRVTPEPTSCCSSFPGDSGEQAMTP